MWKVGDVEPVRVMGAEGYPYGFNVATENGEALANVYVARRTFASARLSIQASIAFKSKWC